MEAEKNAIDIQILATVFASCLEFAERLWMKVSRMLCDWRAKKLHPFAVVFCWFSHIWSLESHIAQWVSHCYSSSTCITFQVVPLDVSFQVCFMSMAVWCFSYTWMCFFFEVGARRARRVICGTDPRKNMLINFDVLCRWCLTYITFCLGTMQLCHIDGWWTLLCSGSCGSARCLPLVVRCGAGERAPRFFWCGKKVLRFLVFFSWWYFIVVFPWLAWCWWSSSCLYSICFHLYDSFALLLLHCMTFQVDASLTLLLLLWCRCVFCMSVFFLSGFALSRSTLHMRLRLLLHDQKPRYRRLYHFVAIRDWWSAIIVDTLFGGQLIHSYIQDINTSLTYHFWLSGYPASSFFCGLDLSGWLCGTRVRSV